ncbi:MAG: hypothetical protein KY442_02780 [Proteobacteria bacterium]|nr:hypothetical protein [Pseudomonadota bacterium]
MSSATCAACGNPRSTATAAAHGVELRLVDAGGGLGVAFGGGAAFDVQAFAAGIHELRPPDGCRLAIEPGRLLDLELAEGAQKLYSMGCDVEEACPALSIPMEDWALEDPKGKPIERVRQIRDDIAARVRRVVAELDALEEHGAS